MSFLDACCVCMSGLYMIAQYGAGKIILKFLPICQLKQQQLICVCFLVTFESFEFCSLEIPCSKKVAISQQFFFFLFSSLSYKTLVCVYFVCLCHSKNAFNFCPFLTYLHLAFSELSRPFFLYLSNQVQASKAGPFILYFFLIQLFFFFHHA